MDEFFRMKFPKLQLTSAINLEGGGNFNRQGGFRASLIPLELNIATPFLKEVGGHFNISAEGRFGTGPFGKYGFAGRIGLGTSYLGLEFKPGIHESGRPIIGGEVILLAAISRHEFYSNCLGFIPTFVLGFEKLLANKAAPSENIFYAGMRWSYSWFIGDRLATGYCHLG